MTTELRWSEGRASMHPYYDMTRTHWQSETLISLSRGSLWRALSGRINDLNSLAHATEPDGHAAARRPRCSQQRRAAQRLIITAPTPSPAAVTLAAAAAAAAALAAAAITLLPPPSPLPTSTANNLPESTAEDAPDSESAPV